MSHTSSKISLSPDISEFFQGVLAEALLSRDIEMTPAAERYVVMLLADFANPAEELRPELDKPVTLLLREAMDASGSERFRRLRTLGDRVMYALGFFGSRMERGTDRSYVVHCGVTAYQSAAEMVALKNAPSGPDVLRELAQKYDGLVDTLRDVSERSLASAAKDQRSVVRLYQRWLDTGSPVLAEELGARGLVPVKGNGSLN